jgi:hypothetical protein
METRQQANNEEEEEGLCFSSCLELKLDLPRREKSFSLLFLDFHFINIFSIII